jgi:protein required for attachment to host cells
MRKINPSTMVVVSDAGRCRLLHLNNSAQLIEIESLVNTLARRANADLVTDRPGRSHDRSGSGRHSMQPKTNAKDSAAKNFAKQVAAKLNADLRQYQFLVLVAPPSFLGLLRSELADNTRAKVALELTKDLSYLSPLEIHCSVNEALSEL